MKTSEMELAVRRLVEKYNVLPNKSGYLEIIKRIMSKDYELRLKLGQDQEFLVFSTPYLGELEGVVEGLIIANDYDYFGKSEKNPMYRYKVEK